MPARLQITWGHARLCGSKRDLVARFVQRLSEFLRAQLLCLRERFGTLLDVADPVVEDLPDQPPEHVLKAATLLIYRRVSRLASAKSLFHPFGPRLE